MYGAERVCMAPQTLDSILESILGSMPGWIDGAGVTCIRDVEAEACWRLAAADDDFRP
jgi:hypothetical protein